MAFGRDFAEDSNVRPRSIRFINREFNLPVTSFARNTNVETAFDIRWFTPTIEIGYTFVLGELMKAVWPWNTRNHIRFVSNLKESGEQ